MLSPGCQRFLRTAQAGSTARHRRRCVSCDGYVSLLETLEGERRPLPVSLRERLSNLPDTADFEEPAPRAPRLALPAHLRNHLEAIAPSRPRLPLFAGSPIYSVAASYVIVLAVAALWGNPVALAKPRIEELQNSAVEAVSSGGEAVESWLDRVHEEFGRRSSEARGLGSLLVEGVEDALPFGTDQGEPR